MTIHQRMTLPRPTADLDQGKRNLDRYGVTVHPGFLSAEQLARLRERVEEQADLEREQGLASFAYDDSDRNIVDSYSDIFIGKPVGLPRLQRVHFLVNKGRCFIELACHPLAGAYAQHVFRGIGYNVGSQHGLVLRKGVPSQPIHIDQLQVPFPTPFPLGMNVKVALGRFTEAMGATRFAPGTQSLSPFDPDQPPRELETQALELEPGDAAIWESRVWHGQGPSVSDEVRYSAMTLYTVNFLKPPEYFSAIIHDHVYATMTQEERVLYGFNYNVGGRIGPRRPDDNRINTNFIMPYIPELHRDGGDSKR